MLIFTIRTKKVDDRQSVGKIYIPRLQQRNFPRIPRMDVFPVESLTLYTYLILWNLLGDPFEIGAGFSKAGLLFCDK